MLSLFTLLPDPARLPGVESADKARATASDAGFDALFAAAAVAYAAPETPIEDPAGGGTVLPALPGERQAIADNGFATLPVGAGAAAEPAGAGQPPGNALPDGRPGPGLPAPALLPPFPGRQTGMPPNASMHPSATAGPPAAPLDLLAAAARLETGQRANEMAPPPVAAAARPAGEALLAAAPETMARAATSSDFARSTSAAPDGSAMPMPSAAAGRATSGFSGSDTGTPLATAPHPTLESVGREAADRPLDARPPLAADTAGAARGDRIAANGSAGGTLPVVVPATVDASGAAASAAPAPSANSMAAAVPVFATPAGTQGVARGNPATADGEHPRGEGYRPRPALDATGSIAGRDLPAEPARVRQAADILRQWQARAAATESSAAEAPGTAPRHVSAVAAAAATASAPGMPAHAAATPAEAPVLSLTDARAAAEQLVQRVLQGQAKSMSSLRFQLSPAELGQLQVNMRRHGDRLEISFTASHAGARDMIEASLPNLRALLQDVGIQLTDADVRHEAPGRDPSRGSYAGTGQRDGDGGQPQRGKGDSHSSGGSAPDSLAGDPSAPSVNASGGFDAFA